MVEVLSQSISLHMKTNSNGEKIDNAGNAKYSLHKQQKLHTMVISLFFCQMLYYHFSMVFICLCVVRVLWCNGLFIFNWKWLLRECNEWPLLEMLSLYLQSGVFLGGSRAAYNSMDHCLCYNVCCYWFNLYCTTKACTLTSGNCQIMISSNPFGINCISSDMLSIGG